MPISYSHAIQAHDQWIPQKYLYMIVKAKEEE